GEWSIASGATFYAHWIPAENSGPTNPPTNPGPSNPGPSTPTPSTPEPSTPSVVVKSGDKAIVELGADVTLQNIPVQDIGGLHLQVKAGDTILSVQADTLKKWLLAAGHPSEATIEVAITPVSIGNTSVKGSGQAQVEAAGIVYDISMKLKYDDTVIELYDAAGGVEMTLAYSPEADQDLLGVYYYNEASQEWEYVGGSMQAAQHTMTAAVTQFGKYAVLAYTKSFADVPASHWAARTLEVLT